MQETKISWTNYSANLLKYRDALGKTVWACVHATEGCRNCYSEALAKRWGRGEAFTAENMKGLTPYFDTDEANQILRSKKIAGKRVFVDDMSDLFGSWVPYEIIDQHFAVFALRPDVTFQVLTKRAERMRDYFNTPNPAILDERQLAVLDALCNFVIEHRENQFVVSTRRWLNANKLLWGYFTQKWPLPNVHLGVSVEDQKTADERLPLLLETPAAIRWASIEPLLSDTHLCGLGLCCPWREHQLDGIVIGGESGAGHREMPLGTALALVRDAQEEGVSVFIKQDSGPRPGMQGRWPDDLWSLKEWPNSQVSATASALPAKVG